MYLLVNSQVISLSQEARFIYFFFLQDLRGMLRESWFSKCRSDTMSHGEIQTLAEAGRDGCSPQSSFTIAKDS